MKVARISILICIAVTISTGLANSHTYSLDNGETFDFEENKGSWVVLAYWAIWCGPCRDEIKILNQIHEERDKHNVVVLGINFDGVVGEELAKDKAFFDAKYPDLLEDPRGRWGSSRAKVIPETLIISPDGVLHKVITGITTRKEILKSLSK